MKKQVEDRGIRNAIWGGHEAIYDYLRSSKKLHEQMYEELRVASNFPSYWAQIDQALYFSRSERQQNRGNTQESIDRHALYERRYQALHEFFSGFVAYLVTISVNDPEPLKILNDGQLSVKEQLQKLRSVYAENQQFSYRVDELVALKVFAYANIDPSREVVDLAIMLLKTLQTPLALAFYTELRLQKQRRFFENLFRRR